MLGMNWLKRQSLDPQEIEKYVDGEIENGKMDM